MVASFLALPVGCVQDARFDPKGCDWNLTGSWTVDGEPASAASCGDGNGGITEVQLFIWNEELDEAWTDDQVLLFDCNPVTTDGGAPRFLDTKARSPRRCGDTGRILRAGTYSGQWVARDSLNNILDCKPLEVLVPPTAPSDVVDVGVALFRTDAAQNSTATSVLDICPASPNTPP